MTKNNGQSSEDIFVDAIKLVAGSFIHKFTDTKSTKGSFIVKAVPADFIVALPERIEPNLHRPAKLFLAEVKSCSDPVSFPFSQIEKSQWVAATLLAKMGLGNHYLFIVHSLHHDQWYCLSALELISHDKKSIKWADMSHIILNRLYGA